MSKNRYFNFNSSKAESQEQQKEKLNELFTSKYIAQHFLKIESLKDDLNRFPSKDEFFFLQTAKAFNAFTFIPMICRIHRVKELHASTYGISRKVVDALVELHDKGMIEQVTLLVSDSMIKRNPIVIEHLKSLCASRKNIKVMYAWTHAKICLLKTDDFDFVIEGSGNWSENAHFEQYVFANSKGLYDFRMSLFTSVDVLKY